jgi:hypothetical protein
MTTVKPEIKFGFIEMLFALTVGEIATQAARLTVPGLAASRYVASYAHCVLALIVVAASWVGWSRSQAPGHVKDTHTVLSWSFVVMVIDLLLVCVYFFLAKGVDVLELPDRSLKEIPSAENETLWLMVIFLGYALWDVITKWDKLKARKFRESRTDATIVCVAISVATYWLLHRATSTSAVLLTDVSLASLTLLFRAMKQRAQGWRTGLALLCGSSFLAAIWCT